MHGDKAVRHNVKSRTSALTCVLTAQKAEEGDEGWEALLKDLQTLTKERLESAKKLLGSLLDSGEINVLDRKIVEGVNR